MNKLHKNLFAALVAGAFLPVGSAQANFLVAEFGTGKAELYGTTGSHLSTFAGGFITPIGVTEGDGFVFVSDLLGSYVFKYSTNGTPLGVVNQGAVGGNHQPAGIAFVNGRIHTSAYNINYLTSQAPDVWTEDGDPNTPSAYYYYTPAPDGNVHGLASAVPNGFSDIVYYTTSAANGSGTMGWWQPAVGAGTIVVFPTNSSPRGVVAAGANTMYVALLDADKVVKCTHDGVSWSYVDWKTNVASPVGLAINSGTLYVSSYVSQTITGYSLADGSEVSQFYTVSSPQYFAVVSFGGSEPPPAPQLQLLSASIGSATLQFNAVSNATYTVEYATTLSPANWSNLVVIASALSNRVETVVDSSATNVVRFYRAVATRP